MVVDLLVVDIVDMSIELTHPVLQNGTCHLTVSTAVRQVFSTLLLMFNKRYINAPLRNQWLPSLALKHFE